MSHSHLISQLGRLAQARLYFKGVWRLIPGYLYFFIGACSMLAVVYKKNLYGNTFYGHPAKALTALLLITVVTFIYVLLSEALLAVAPAISSWRKFGSFLLAIIFTLFACFQTAKWRPKTVVHLAKLTLKGAVATALIATRIPRFLWTRISAAGALARVRIESAALSDPETIARCERDALASSTLRAKGSSKPTSRL